MRRSVAWMIVVVLVAAAGAAVGARQELVITREAAKEYHRPGCPVVAGAKDVLLMPRGQAEARGMKPHRECDPAYVPPPEKPATVFIDGSKFYHREKCAKLGKSPRSITVNDAAARKLWPCRTCKPPIRKRS